MRWLHRACLFIRYRPYITQMPDHEAHPPEESLRPEYAGGNVHPHAQAADRTEPWLIATAGFLADQDFDHDFATGRRYDAPSMVRAFVYKRLVDISSFHRLTSHLNGNPRVRQSLGFSEEIPAGDTFREWWKNRLDEQQRKVTENIADTIMAPRLGRLLLDLELPEGRRFFHIPEPEPDPIEITPEQKQDAIEHIRPMVYGDLDFDRADNREDDAPELLDYQAEVSEDQDYIQKTLEEKDDHGEDPISPRGYFGAVENRDADDWEEQFQDAYDKQLQAARGAGMFDRPVPVYIDGTIRPFYQFTPGDTMQEAVKYLIREAEKHVSIKEIAMDSAFRKVEMLQWLDDRGHEFTIQFPKNGERVKLALARMESEYDYVEGYYVQSSDKKTRLDDLTLVAEPDYNNVDGDFDFSTNATAGQYGLDDFDGGLDMESASLEDMDDRLWKGRRAYLTNKDIEDKDDAERVIKRYDQRWTIETKYRVIKNEFLGKTTSRKFPVRTFFWLFACMFYNAWILLDVFLRADHPDLAPEDRPVMPARSFAREFFKVDYG